MAAPKTYEVAETLRGFHVIENNANGAHYHTKLYNTREAAQNRVAQLTAMAARSSAVADVRKRARFRCECLGECGMHVRRCTALHDRPLEHVVGITVALKVVALDHDLDNLALDNLRSYCQICLQRHEAEERGSDALFEVGGEK